jgi:L,D-transpeptidase YcbB
MIQLKNKFFLKRLLLSTFCLFCFAYSQAQIQPVQMQQYITEHKSDIKNEVVSFYTSFNYHPAWLGADNKQPLLLLVNAINSCENLGLRQSDYPISFIESILNQTATLHNLSDSLQADIKITEAAIHFYSDISFGNTTPSFGYYGISYKPTCFIIPDLLATSLSTKMLHLLPFQISSALPEVKILEKEIQRLSSVINNKDFKEVTITSNKVNSGNKPLVEKLYQLGVVNDADSAITDMALQQKVKEVQKRFNLLADGTLRTTTIEQLNISTAKRRQQLILAVNYYRWLHCLQQKQSVIVVNLPAAYLKVYKNDKVVLEMRMVVGKKSTPTPTLASSVKEVILYPYWHVPFSIATKELLPAIKRNPGYINAGNYQVLNSAGKIMDPYAINWHAFSTNYFPYLIRQSTGCDNALGLLKLNFDNPYSVYLHDTPSKNLFSVSKRYYSHGCMRMQKPMEIGHLVLRNNQLAIDTLEQKGCLRNQAPIHVKATDPMPVIVWYNPAGIDSTGRVLFFEDVYGKFK